MANYGQLLMVVTCSLESDDTIRMESNDNNYKDG